MIAAWMLWSAGIGVLFLVAGLAAERLLTHGDRPTRWVWIVAGAATTALSVLRIPGAPPEPAVVPPPGFAPPLLEPLTVTVARDSMLRSLDDLLVLGWVVLSSLLVVTVLFAFARLVREGRSWQPGSLGHRSVFWSRDTGPTIVGLLRPRVVLPAWVRAMGPSEQELILAHEEEHIRAGDARLRFLMTLPLFVFPWNPALWLQRHRLNLAVELDCDRRVMRRMPGHRHAYGNLLLRVGAGQNGLHRVALVALSEGRSQLERRITRLEEQIPRVRRLQGALLVLGAAAIVALAVLFPRVRGEDAPVSDELVDLMAEPVFTPYTVRPDLVNERTVMQALEAEYPPILRDAGIGGTTNVRFFIDTRGVVQRVLVAETSGHEALDSAALRVARTFRFTPALNLDEIVSVWIAIPITFSTGAAGADGVPDEVREFADSIARERRDDPGGPPADPEARQEASLADGMQQPTFTRYTVRPDLVNQREVQRAALEREYPPVLREAGIGGTVNVQLLHRRGGQGAKDPRRPEHGLRFARRGCPSGCERVPVHARAQPGRTRARRPRGRHPDRHALHGTSQPHQRRGGPAGHRRRIPCAASGCGDRRHGPRADLRRRGGCGAERRRWPVVRPRSARRSSSPRRPRHAIHTGAGRGRARAGLDRHPDHVHR